MDERPQPDGGTGHTETSAWRVNGVHSTVGARGDQGWSSAGAALEPSAEPLALLAAGQAGGDARHRQPHVPGLDEETPVSGVPVVEPPLWREAARHSHRSAAGYGPPSVEYRSTPVADLVEPGAATPPPDQPGEPEPPVEWAPAEPAGFAGFVDSVAPAGAVEPAGLPQRVPAEPDVPVSGEPVRGARSLTEPTASRDRWTAPELAWIADQLRRDDVPGEATTGSFDVDAVVAAVREVPGVQSASVRTNPTGMHTLRLDLADDADPGDVSRAVARLLLERMGLAAAPQHVPQARTPQPAAPLDGPASPEAPRESGPLRDSGVSWESGPLGESEVPRARGLSGESGAPPESGGSPDHLTVPAQVRGAQDGWVYEGLDGYPVPGGDNQPVPEPVSRPLPHGQPGPRVVIDQVQVRTVGLEATVEVLLTAGDRQATGVARGPAVDSYLVRLAAVAAARAIDSLLRGVSDANGPSRCFVEHTGVVAFGNAEVALVVLLLVCGGWVEQLTGSALVDGDPRQAVVRATLGAVNRRLEALLD